MERRRAVVDGRFAPRISYTDGTRYARVVGRGNERPQPRSREAHPMRLARHCLPHTRIREIRVSKASHPISATSERVRDHKMRGNRRAENYADLSGGMAAADKSVSLSGGVVRPAT